VLYPAERPDNLRGAQLNGPRSALGDRGPRRWNRAAWPASAT